ncbi:MAG: putative metallopeptidase [Deltaproteobacteria bacterium]
MRRHDGRPQLGPALRRLIRDAAERLPELGHVRASGLLVVAGEARRASRATIRPLGGKGKARPEVYFRGRRILYLITLRPQFFRCSTPEQRVETILHELFHMSARFDGTLHRGRRHSALPGRKFGRRLRPLVRRYLESVEPELLEPFAHDGEVLVRQWLEKPPLVLRGRRATRRRYDEAQLFLGAIEMITEKRRFH